MRRGFDIKINAERERKRKSDIERESGGLLNNKSDDSSSVLI